jgi:hypothetical protein
VAVSASTTTKGRTMPRAQRIKKRLLATLMAGTVLSVVGYGSAVAANIVSMPRGDAENPASGGTGTAVATFVVTVHVSGSGDGVVVSDPPGIHCPSVCSASFPVGTDVTLHAKADGDSDVSGWSGDCGDGDDCTVGGGSPDSITVGFTTAMHRLSVARTGHGFVTSGRPGIHCPGSCGHPFAQGLTVQLQYHAAKGWHFKAWDGACSGKKACAVHMKGARHVVAHFAKNAS